MDLITIQEGMLTLVPVTKQMMEHITLFKKINCFELCDILRLKLTTYVDVLNAHMMNDGSGYFFGCICND
jgi:hypothetical protein